ncbi:MAG: NAD(+)/NADH kinase [Chloroflexi bacterium]|nr:NAD(+)/NADH kinase [Chloroflexota bacterium]
MRRSVAIVYNPSINGAQELVGKLLQRLKLDRRALYTSIEDLERRGEGSLKVDLLLTVGGDGTILHAAHLAAPQGVPILGINMGRLGFMTELGGKEALENVERYLVEELWIEERAMLQARIAPAGVGQGEEGYDPWAAAPLCLALNEAVVGSSAVARMATIRVFVDDAFLAEYRADSVIVATATGSTGYSLSAGGPILHPLSRDIILNPVAVHLGLSSPLALPPTSRIRLGVVSQGPASLSVDGFIDLRVSEGDEVLLEASPYKARFLRSQPPSHYYATLMRRLGLEGGELKPRALR